MFEEMTTKKRSNHSPFIISVVRFAAIAFSRSNSIRECDRTLGKSFVAIPILRDIAKWQDILAIIPAQLLSKSRNFPIHQGVMLTLQSHPLGSKSRKSAMPRANKRLISSSAALRVFSSPL